MTQRAKIHSLTALLLGLAACSTPQSQDVVRMDVSRDGNSVTGTYFASEFSQQDVRRMVGQICSSAGFSGFSQSLDGAALTSFSATCTKGSPFGGSAGASFRRAENGAIDYAVTYSRSGTIVQERRSFSL